MKMDVKKIEKHLKVENLEAHIVDLIQKSKTEAENDAKELVEEILTSMKNEVFSFNVNISYICESLILLKTIIYNSNYSDFHYYLTNFRKSSIFQFDLNSKVDNDLELARYIINHINSLGLSFIGTIGKFNSLQNEVLSYYKTESLISKISVVFLELDKLNLIKEFSWNINTLDKGLSSLFKDLTIKYETKIDELNSKIRKQELKIELENEKYKSEISRLKDDFDFEVRSLNRDIESKEYTIELYKDYTKKYLENQPYYVQNTYFGDNLPFLINVYNFLVKNQFVKGLSWSYFYSCLVIGNNEIINLTNNGKLNFIGRFFYFLKNYIDIKYRSNNEYKDFIYQKFYINEAAMSEAFYRNYVVDYYDETKHKNLAEIDAFFSKQDEIFLKT